MPHSNLTSTALLITHYVTPSLQIMAPVLTLMIGNMHSCTAAILHGNFPRGGLNSPRQYTSTQEETRSSSEYSEATAKSAEHKPLWTPRGSGKSSAFFFIFKGLQEMGVSQNFKSNLSIFSEDIQHISEVLNL